MAELALAEVERRVRAAEARRAAAPERAEVDAYRVVNGPADLAPPGLVVDRYLDWLVVGHREQVPPPVVDLWVEGAAAALAPRGVVVKTIRRRARASDSRVALGEVPRGPVVVREHGARLLVDLDAGVQTGLFLDHRGARLACRAHAAGEEVLNLFAYTGAFSVHAALAGARRVTSVDVARRALERGRENMRASGLDPDGHRWFDDDVVAHLRRGAAGTYGLVIVDPPLLGHAEGRTFALLNDLGALAAGALRKLRPGGVLLFSTHALELTSADLLAVLERAAAGRALEVLSRLGLPPWDHPVLEGPAAGDDRGGYLKTLVLRVA